jgi:hypothetical protein
VTSSEQVEEKEEEKEEETKSLYATGVQPTDANLSQITPRYSKPLTVAHMLLVVLVNVYVFFFNETLIYC